MKYTEELLEITAKNFQDTLDFRVRDVLMYGTGKSLVNPTPLFLFWLKVKRKIRTMRMKIAEWIGGNSLHEFC